MEICFARNILIEKNAEACRMNKPTAGAFQISVYPPKLINNYNPHHINCKFTFSTVLKDAMGCTYCAYSSGSNFPWGLTK
jgi:hypothetical protein